MWPSWQSGWLRMRSQEGSNSSLELVHGLNELPVKGKVLVRPLDGPNAGLVFEGIGSAQRDDDVDEPYCGVVLLYNADRVKLAAPSLATDFDSGRIFCAGEFIYVPPFSLKVDS